MGRPRIATKAKLPPGLYERGGYWSWRDRLTGKEHGLGRIPRHEAVRQVLEVEADPRRETTRFRQHREIPPLAKLSHAEIVAASIKNEDQSGIYFLVRDGQVMYVGQSIRVARRIAEHAQDKTRPFDGHHFIPVHISLLNDTECAYIAALEPPWNVNQPSPYRRRNVGVLNAPAQAVDS